MLLMVLAGEGCEQNAPLGRAVIGRRIPVTLMTLFVVPAVYSANRTVKRFHKRDAEFEAITCQVPDWTEQHEFFDLTRSIRRRTPAVRANGGRLRWTSESA